MCPVWGVYNQSQGFVSDLAQCLMDKNQFQGTFSRSADEIARSGLGLWENTLMGKRIAESRMLDALSRNAAQVSLFRFLRSDAGKGHEIFAHSQGNLILSNVLQAIAAVDGPTALAGRIVHTFGSPTVYYPPVVQKYEHGYTFDPVNWLSGFDRSFTISKVGMPSGSLNPITHGFLWYLQDDPRFIINRFRTGGWGMTFNMDEEGLANCLVSMGTNLRRIHKIIEHLHHYQNSDADDVVVLYIQKIRNDTAIRNALRQSKNTVELMIQTLEEGYTSSDEKEAISWLKSLN
jgi:hypothetical protein